KEMPRMATSKPVAAPIVMEAPKPTTSIPYAAVPVKEQRTFAQAWRQPAFPNAPIVVKETVTVQEVPQQASVRVANAKPMAVPQAGRNTGSVAAGRRPG